MSNQGAEATSGGQWLQYQIEEMIMQQFPKTHAYQWAERATFSDLLTPNTLARNVPYDSIYEKQTRSEFVFSAKQFDLRLRIECKYQEVSGSTDEKFPYVYLNAVRCPEPYFMLIAEGDGAHPASIKWFEEMCRQRWLLDGKAKQIFVKNASSFRLWLRTLKKDLAA